MADTHPETAPVRTLRFTAATFFVAAVASAVAAVAAGSWALGVAAGCHTIAWSCFVTAANQHAARDVAAPRPLSAR